MAAHCDGLAQNNASPAAQLLLMEAAKQWRHLADASGPSLPIGEPSIQTLATRDDILIAWLLSQSGALIR
jgi:hypothetical protein